MNRLPNVAVVKEFFFKKKVIERGKVDFKYFSLRMNQEKAIRYARTEQCEIRLGDDVLGGYSMPPAYTFSVLKPNGEHVAQLTEALAYQLASMWAGTEVYEHLTVLRHRSTASDVMAAKATLDESSVAA